MPDLNKNQTFEKGSKASYFEIALLNSKAVWLVFTGSTTMVRGGFYEATTQNIEPLPIPPATNTQKANLAALAEKCQTVAEARYKLQKNVRRPIPDLCPPNKAPKLTTKLKNWWELPDFAAFQKEIKKAFKTDIPLKDRNDWEDWLTTDRAEIETHEAEINRLVYTLFDLTKDEIALLEANI